MFTLLKGGSRATRSEAAKHRYGKWAIYLAISFFTLLHSVLPRGKGEAAKSAVIGAVLMALAVTWYEVLPRIKKRRNRNGQEWRTPEYVVRVVGGFRDVRVEYEEGGRSLTLRAEWDYRREDLAVWMENQVYLPPDTSSALSEERTAEIQQRVSEALTELNIPHGVVRVGWSSVR